MFEKVFEKILDWMPVPALVIWLAVSMAIVLVMKLARDSLLTDYGSFNTIHIVGVFGIVFIITAVVTAIIKYISKTGGSK